jgi:hypothetical protein
MIQYLTELSVSRLLAVSRQFCLVFGVLVVQSLHAQQSPTSPVSTAQQDSNGQSKQRSAATEQLTDGLLELLDESPKSKSSSSAQPSPSKLPGQAPADTSVPTAPTGQGFNASSSSPLLAVRDSMHRASLYLQQGKSDRVTVETQNDVIQRLDQLIGQLEQQQQTAPEEKSKQSSNTAGQQRQQQRAATTTETPESNSETKSSTTPGDRGKPADTNVRLKDPTALQKSVWGHLPGRVRTQMESRMVEEFLPSYREQIEAYYRALLGQGADR